MTSILKLDLSMDKYHDKNETSVSLIQMLQSEQTDRKEARHTGRHTGTQVDVQKGYYTAITKTLHVLYSRSREVKRCTRKMLHGLFLPRVCFA